jgi:hypothetical protein
LSENTFFFLLSEYGLAGYYSNHKDVTVICWRYMSLPLLPVNEVGPQLKRIEGFIKAIKERAVRKLLRTFHNEYIIKYWCKKVTPARFCVFGSRHKTNNACESLHKKMKRNLTYHSGNFD